MAQTSGRVRGVILDVDGTLIDSNDAHAEAWREALKRSGHLLSTQRIRPLIGMGGDQLLPSLVGIQADSPEGKRISAERREIFQAWFVPQLKPFPGARELLLRMKAEGLKLAVATSASRADLKVLLGLLGPDIPALMEGQVTKDDASRSKPEPDLVEAALRELGGIDRGEALMLGDTPYDIEAAARAGVRTIALRCGGWSEAALRGALAVFQDPEDLLRSWAHSPLAAEPRAA